MEFYKIERKHGTWRTRRTCFMSCPLSQRLQLKQFCSAHIIYPCLFYTTQTNLRLKPWTNRFEIRWLVTDYESVWNRPWKDLEPSTKERPRPSLRNSNTSAGAWPAFVLGSRPFHGRFQTISWSVTNQWVSGRLVHGFKRKLSWVGCRSLRGPLTDLDGVLRAPSRRYGSKRKSPISIEQRNKNKNKILQ